MKKVLIGLAILIVLAIAAAVATPFLVPAQIYKSRLIAEVKKATGRDLKIDGPVTFNIFPQIELRAEDVSFGNAAGGEATEMARLESIEVRLKPLPLLHGDIAIESFVLERPAIALEINRDGRPNWLFLPRGAARDAEETERVRHGIISVLGALHITDLELRDGTVSYFDARTGRRHAATDIYMKFSMADLDSRFTAEGSATWNGENVRVEVGIDRPSAFDNGAPTPMTLGIFAAPLHFAFSGKGEGVPEVRLDGDVVLAVPSVKDFARWAGEPLGDINGFGPLIIRGKLELENGRYAFGDAEIAFDAIRGHGGIQFDDSGPRPHVQGSLALGMLDLNPYLPAAPAMPSAAPRPAAAHGTAADSDANPWSAAQIDTRPLKLFDADFFLGFDSIRYHNVTVGKSSVIFVLKNGRLTADLTELALYGGKGKGRVVLDGSGPVPAVAQSFELKGVNIQPLLHDADNVTLLSGIGNLDMAVQGRGRSQRDIVGSLSGTGSLHLDQGALRGVDIVHMVKSRSGVMALNWIGLDQESVFAGFSASYTIADGVLKNTDLRMDLPNLPTTGVGTVDLPHRRVTYRLTAKVDNSITVPVDVGGPWDHLTYKPDIHTTLENFLPDWLIDLLGLGK